jgi:transaldolase/glucose-6-phosphate isomerase
MITARDPVDAAIPSLPYTFSLLKQAQARGDQEALESRGRAVLRVHLNEPVDAGLRQLLRWVRAVRLERRPQRKKRATRSRK